MWLSCGAGDAHVSGHNTGSGINQREEPKPFGSMTASANADSWDNLEWEVCQWVWCSIVHVISSGLKVHRHCWVCQGLLQSVLVRVYYKPHWGNLLLLSVKHVSSIQ